jgi:hypothetical protein
MVLLINDIKRIRKISFSGYNGGSPAVKMAGFFLRNSKLPVSALSLPGVDFSDILLAANSYRQMYLSYGCKLILA